MNDKEINKNLEMIRNSFISFMNGARVLMLIDRGIGNNNKGSRRWINKIITTTPEEFMEAAEKLLHLQYYLANSDIRLYSCINARDMDKAIKNFHHAQIDIDKNQYFRFYQRINDVFCSSLMRPESRAEKYFLLDIDTQEYNDINFINVWLDNFEINVIKKYITSKGWHYIVRPLNILSLDEVKENIPVTLQKDGLLLLNYLDN